MQKRAIALFSGGLDSILAAKLIMDQGIDVLGINFVTEFSSSDVEDFKKKVIEAAGQIDLKLKTVNISSEFLKLLENPRYGFGANINPCIDCKIFMLIKAKQMMEGLKASFIITGEVLGERPMSQRRDALNAIEKRSGLRGYLLRPLTAKHMLPTVPENENIVNRDMLLDISGRSRKIQLDLAEKYGVKKYFTPAGGCLLTDPGFTKKLKDIIAHKTYDLENIRLLKYGRHFRLNGKTKFVLGRDNLDNKNVMKQKKDGDFIIEPKGYSGPVGMLRGEASLENLNMAAGILVSYTKRRNEKNIPVRYWQRRDKKEILIVNPIRTKEKDAKRI